MSGRQQVDRSRKKLKASFSRVGDLQGDAEIQADFARYLVVLVSGYFETSLSALLTDFTYRTASPKVAKYVERKLRRLTNVNAEKLVQLVGAFDEEWADLVDEVLADGGKDALDSVVAVRHQIVHGGDHGITYNRVKEYFESIDRIVKTLEDLLGEK